METTTGLQDISEEGTHRGAASARVLSYNFNILPRGCGGYQHERIDTFLATVDAYDVLLLQEVYSTSALPYTLQKRFCFQKCLLDGLKEKGFHYYVISRQPSYRAMVKFGLVSDNGLIIASRFPIWHRGSYTFRTRERGPQQSMIKGCLFAEVEIPSSTGGGERVVFFNVHLRPEEGMPSGSTQVQQMRRFVENVLLQLQSPEWSDASDLSSGEREGCPFVIAGDFNIHGIDKASGQSTKKLTDFLNELAPLGEMRDVLYESCGSHPATRPPQLFFPSQSKLERFEAIPQRQDYLLANSDISATSTKVEKFVVSSRRPYTYLSDHFGISTTLSVRVNKHLPEMLRSPSRLSVTSLVEEARHEQSNPTSSFHTEALVAFIVAWFVFSFSWKPLILFALIWVGLLAMHYSVVALPTEKPTRAVSKEVVSGKAEMGLPVQGPDPLGSTQSVAELWERSVTRNRALRCLGATGVMGTSEWLSYGTVDTRARELGAGLMKLGLVPGSLIGVECEACRNAAVLELTCALYGFATVPLAGKSGTVRTLLDSNKVSIVFAGRSAVTTLLTCRSTSLERIVYLHSFVDDDDQAAAKDLNVTLSSFDSVELLGRQNPCAPLVKPTGETVLTYSIDNVSSKDITALLPVTHTDVLRDLRVLFSTNVLPSYYTRDCIVWFTPFAAQFSRICSLGLFFGGNAVATTDTTHLQEAFARFSPTLLVTSPSQFNASLLQLNRATQRYNVVTKFLFESAYQIRSRLIHVSNRDSLLLRFIFFRAFQRQLGGSVRKIILATSLESTPFSLMEHISVCYAPCTREVSYHTVVGVSFIDGVPAPHLQVELKEMNELAQKAGIGQLAITRHGEPQKLLEIAARWELNSTLTLLGAPSGVLWPVDYQYAISAELERVFSVSRYVDDIFVYCTPLHPVVAVVCPNRDTVEFEWQLHQETEQERPLSWTELVEFGTGLIQADLESIAEEHGLHHTQIPKFVHLHPHSFRNHVTFVTPYGKIRRENVARYFAPVVRRLYSETGDEPTSPLNDSWDAGPESETEMTSMRSEHDRLHLTVPVTIDIGGTFAKIAYVMPPNMRSVQWPSTLQQEASSLSEKLGLRTFDFFTDPESAEQLWQSHPRSPIGTLRFAKIPSQQVPKFIEFLASVQATSSYKSSYMKKVRATGGGAFKYAPLARNMLGVQFDVVKEMDAVVKGLNLVIRMAPESIFTVDHTTGLHGPHCLVSSSPDTLLPYPYLLVNIGSGVSFIKCLGPDGSHVRVGGTPIGGATFWGLTRTMTKLTSWEEVMEIMQLDGPGDNKNVDLLVGDIYGYNAKDLPAMLSSEMVASSFGKFGTERFYSSARVSAADHFADDNAAEILSPMADKPPVFTSVKTTTATSIDIVRSLLNMIAGNVTQLAYLHARLHGIKNFFFAGGFVRNNPITWSLISATLAYWSSGECKAHFLEHDGYLGALGCTVINPAEENAKANQ